MTDTPIETPAVTDDGIVTGTLFRVKPGVINAVRYDGIKDGAALFHIKDGVPAWLEEAMAAPEGPGAIWIPAAPEGADVQLPDIIVLGIKPDHVNPFGMIYVEPGDWILRFPDGLLAVMDDAGFRENYDQATDMDATTPTGNRVREAFDEGWSRGYEAALDDTKARRQALPDDPNRNDVPNMMSGVGARWAESEAVMPEIRQGGGPIDPKSTNGEAP